MIRIPEAEIRLIGYVSSFREAVMEKLTAQQRCTLCPQACGADRDREPGYCGVGTGFEVASVTVHRGEEPVISGTNGICNIFFAGCNLQCVYCQNHQISRNIGRIYSPLFSLSELIHRITTLLDQGIENIGFVSPSHMVPQVKAIIGELHRRGYFPIVVYNTNAYEKAETLRSLEGLVDVYLPDFKYIDAPLAARWSGAADYPSVACAAIKEMYRQKGNRLLFNENGKARSGMIVRHLVLPDSVANSIGVFRFLAEELSTRLAVSVMAQYNPTPNVMNLPPLHRKITASEYQMIVTEVENLGFENGWFQEYDSVECYNPDFSLPEPFGGDAPH
jgi:putative pyruvate formate lyase activating enzyme